MSLLKTIFEMRTKFLIGPRGRRDVMGLGRTVLATLRDEEFQDSLINEAGKLRVELVEVSKKALINRVTFLGK